MAGVKGRSGRKKITVNSENGKARLDMLLPQAVSVVEDAIAMGDKDMAKWVCEMRFGKPRQQISGDMELRQAKAKELYDAILALRLEAPKQLTGYEEVTSEALIQAEEETP